MTDVKHPTFDPAYVPMEGKQDSILIACHDVDTNVFTYNAWDGVARWFVIDGPDGSPVFSGSMAVGDTVLLPSIPGYIVHYYSGDIYDYKIVPGRCQTQETTTTSTTSTPTSTTWEETTTTTAPQESTTTSTPIETTTTVESPTSSTEATVQGTSTSLVSLPTVLDCAYYLTRNLQAPSEMDCESSPVPASIVQTAQVLRQTSRDEAPTTGVDLIQAIMLAVALILVGLLVTLPCWVHKLPASWSTLDSK